MIKLMQVGFGQWAFLFGSENTPISKASLLPMGDWGTVFQSRDLAEWAANAQGLLVETDGLVVAE